MPAYFDGSFMFKNENQRLDDDDSDDIVVAIFGVYSNNGFESIRYTQLQPHFGWTNRTMYVHTGFNLDVNISKSCLSLFAEKG